MEIYKKIAEVSSKEAFDDLLDEIIDRFGIPPMCVTNLIKISLVRNMARAHGVESIVQTDEYVKIFYVNPPEELPVFVCRAEKVRGRMFFSNNDKACFTLKLQKNEDVLGITQYIINLFTEFSEKLNKSM